MTPNHALLRTATHVAAPAPYRPRAGASPPSAVAGIRVGRRLFTDSNLVTTLASNDGDRDGVDPELLARAIAVCRNEKQRSVSLLQRRLCLGSTVASDLLDAITERGLMMHRPLDASQCCLSASG